MRCLLLALVMLFQVLPGAVAQVGALPNGSSPARLCRLAIEVAERRHAIPSRLLHAIGRVESGRPDPATGEVHPWPWAVNVEGRGSFHDTKAQAIAAVAAMHRLGSRSIDVGCMQINLMYHPNAFAGLEQAFDPMANADYAARFLRRLFEQTGTWAKAAAWYHSATPELGDAYQKRVMAAWPEEQRRFGGRPVGLAAAWQATLPASIPVRPVPGRIVSDLVREGRDPPTGRGLDAYRAAPITWIYRPAPAATADRGSAGVAEPAPRSVHFLR
jgi:hypothetical protein